MGKDLGQEWLGNQPSKEAGVHATIKKVGHATSPAFPAAALADVWSAEIRRDTQAHTHTAHTSDNISVLTKHPSLSFVDHIYHQRLWSLRSSKAKLSSNPLNLHQSLPP